MIFSKGQRTFLGSAAYGESEFAYLERSARPEIIRGRDLLELWFLEYPEGDDKQELLGRLRSGEDSDFDAAFFELFLYILLSRLGCKIVVYPAAEPGISKKPDFFVTPLLGEPFYLEARVATDTSRQRQGALKRLDQVFDFVKRWPSPNFFIGMEIDGLPNTPVPLRQTRVILEQHLPNLDPDEITVRYEREGMGAVQTWRFEHDGLTIVFRPVPKIPEKRGSIAVNSLGPIITTDWTDPTRAIRKAVKKKTTKYGNLNHPYVIAVNASMWGVDRDCVMEALFGTRSFIFTRPVRDGATPNFQQAYNGIWRGPSRPTNTRVSAVWVFRRLTLWGLAEVSMCLYENPWAVRPMNVEFADFSRGYADDEGSYVFQNGVPAAGVLGIPAAWPEDMAIS